MPSHPEQDDEARAHRPPSAQSVGAAVLLAIGAFLLWTLVLNEDHMGDKVTLLKESAVYIGVPAVAGLVLAALAFRSARPGQRRR